MEQVLNQLRIDLQSWTDGTKMIFVHSPAHMPIVRLVEDMVLWPYVEIMIGSLKDNLDFVEDYLGIGTLILVGDDSEVEAINRVIDSRRDIDVRLVQI